MPIANTLAQKKAKVLQKQEKKQQVENALPMEVVEPERKTKRRIRNSFNGTEGKLKVNREIEGYHLHILNDNPGRIAQAEAAGYEFVTPEEVGGLPTAVVSRNTDLGDKVRFLVGVAEGGGPLYGYLMKQKLEWYEEDQRGLQGRNDKIDSAIRRGSITKEGHTTEGFYSPSGGIKMDN